MALTKVGYTLIKDNFKDSVSGSSTEHSSSYSTRVTLLEGSGSITESSASFSTRTSDLETDSGSFSTRVTDSNLYLSGSGNIISGSATSTGSFGRVLSDTIKATNIIATSTVTAQEFHTEFVSASIIYTSGSTKFGDDANDTHQFTGSIETSGSISLDTIGSNVSGSAISTGSFGAVYASGMTVPNLINVSSSVSSRVNLIEGSGSITESSSSFSTRATTLENANISGGFVAQTVLSGSGTIFSGSATSTASFGLIHTASTGSIGIGRVPSTDLDIGATTSADAIGYTLRMHESDTKYWDIDSMGDPGVFYGWWV